MSDEAGASRSFRKTRNLLAFAIVFPILLVVGFSVDLVDPAIAIPAAVAVALGAGIWAFVAIRRRSKNDKPGQP
ncbi:MAG: hypothetical protein J0H64_07680 [Actinobacteria bacterium]|nr:hypothetical protein [Actinomycetota bacterium]